MFSASQHSSPAHCHIYNGPQRKAAEGFQGRHLLIAHKQLFYQDYSLHKRFAYEGSFPS